MAKGDHPPPNAATVLVVDDEASNVASLERIFKREDMRVLTASGAKAALELVRSHRVEVVLTDLMMPGISGLELLRALKQVSPDSEVVMMTAYGTVETAVQAMREGAYDFVEKPLKRMTIVKTVRMAAEKQSLIAENRSLRQEIKNLTTREIVGSSPVLRRVLDVAGQAAPSNATVLVLGESGTGKELIARFIHQRSTRAAAPFVAVNCSAIPETILEAELFGHERGAFTGATSDGQDGSPKRRAARSFSTKSASSRLRSRSSCCGCCKKMNTSRSGATRLRRMFGSCRPPTRTLRRRSPQGASVKICSTGSTSSPSRRHLCGHGGRMYRCWSITFSGCTAPRTAAPDSRRLGTCSSC